MSKQPHSAAPVEEEFVDEAEHFDEIPADVVQKLQIEEQKKSEEDGVSSGEELSDDAGETTANKTAKPQVSAITSAEFKTCLRAIFLTSYPLHPPPTLLPPPPGASHLRQPGSSLKDMKRMLSFFSAACHVADVEVKKKAKRGAKDEGKDKEKKPKQYRPIATGALFNELMNFCFSELLSCMQDLLHSQDGATKPKSSVTEEVYPLRGNWFLA